MLVAILIFLLLAQPKDADVYSAWTDNGLHLMISDNGTPDNPEDDFICDWEDNRAFEIIVKD